MPLIPSLLIRMVRYLSSVLIVNSCSNKAKDAAIFAPGQRTTLNDLPPKIVQQILGLTISPIVRHGIGNFFALARVSRVYQRWNMVAALHMHGQLVHSPVWWNFVEAQLLAKCMRSW